MRVVVLMALEHQEAVDDDGGDPDRARLPAPVDHGGDDALPELPAPVDPVGGGDVAHAGQAGLVRPDQRRHRCHDDRRDERRFV